MFAKAMAEFVGTFALCFIGGGAILMNAMMGDAGPGLLGIAIAHGLALSIAVTCAMNVSGGHINPAVTIAMLVTRRIGLGGAVVYIVAQLMGGGLAGGVLSQVVFKDLDTPKGESVVISAFNGTPRFDASLAGSRALNERGSASSETLFKAATRAALIEAFLTFLLVFSVFATAVDPRHPNVGGFAIGLTIAMDILVGGPLTGAAMNPARTWTGLVLGVSGTEFWSQQWVYWVGPVVGGVAAALLYDAVIMKREPAK